MSLNAKLSIEQLNDLINQAIKFNLDHIKYNVKND